MTNDPLIQPDDVWQLASNLTINRARHNIKFGSDFRHIRSDRTQGLTVRGQFNFENNNPVGSGNSFADFLLGLPSADECRRSCLDDSHANYPGRSLRTGRLARIVQTDPEPWLAIRTQHSGSRRTWRSHELRLRQRCADSDESR